MRRVLPLVLSIAMLPLAGCRHRVRSVPPPPAPPAEVAPVMVSVPPPTHPTEPLPRAEVPVASVPTVVTPPPHKVRRRKSVAATPAPAPPVQTAAATPAPAIALGQLSAGDDVGKGLRAETEALLLLQKQRLDRLPAPVAAAHAADVEQARRFLKSAGEAFRTGDADGAHTLAIKAKVLLDDLSR